MPYDPRKAAQTIAYLAIKNGAKPLNVVKTVKLVYLADRESMAQFGFPIQDEPRVSMKHGPVNSRTYAFINGEHCADSNGWSQFLTDRADHQIGLANTNITVDDLDELSDADIGVLDKVWNDFGHMNQWQLVDWTHSKDNVPEWEDPGDTSTEIPIERMMHHVGIQNVSAQAELIDSLKSAQRVLENL